MLGRETSPARRSVRGKSYLPVGRRRHRGVRGGCLRSCEASLSQVMAPFLHLFPPHAGKSRCLRASLSLPPFCTHAIALARIPSPSTRLLLPFAFLSRSRSTLRRRMVGRGWTRSDDSPSADCGGRGVVRCLAHSTSLVASSRHVTISYRRINGARDAIPIDASRA